MPNARAASARRCAMTAARPPWSCSWTGPPATGPRRPGPRTRAPAGSTTSWLTPSSRATPPAWPRSTSSSPTSSGPTGPTSGSSSPRRRRALHGRASWRGAASPTGSAGPWPPGAGADGSGRAGRAPALTAPGPTTAARLAGAVSGRSAVVLGTVTLRGVRQDVGAVLDRLTGQRGTLIPTGLALVPVAGVAAQLTVLADLLGGLVGSLAGAGGGA